MARIHLDRELGHELEFVDVTFATSRQARRGGNSRRQRLRRLAGEASRQQVSLFEHLDLVIDPGESVAVLGKRPNDGAVELLRLAAGTLIPDAGHVRRRDVVVPIIDNSGILNASLTVRQNIYLVGVLLGMSPAEVTDRMDWIVDFAGAAKALDGYLGKAPRFLRQRIVWTVSMATGARAFAIENALVVGQDEFEASCWSHVESLKADGVTFLVHVDDHDGTRRFCDRAVVLSTGRIVADTTVDAGLAALRGDGPLAE